MGALSPTPIKYMLLNIFTIVIGGLLITLFSIQRDAKFIEIPCINTTVMNHCCIHDDVVVACHFTTAPIVATFSFIVVILIYILILLLKFCPPPDKK